MVPSDYEYQDTLYSRVTMLLLFQRVGTEEKLVQVFLPLKKNSKLYRIPLKVTKQNRQATTCTSLREQE